MTFRMDQTPEGLRLIALIEHQEFMTKMEKSIHQEIIFHSARILTRLVVKELKEKVLKNISPMQVTKMVMRGVSTEIARRLQTQGKGEA